jgi:hypothetical protein
MRLEQLKGNLEGQIRAVTGSGNTRQTSLLFAPPPLCSVLGPGRIELGNAGSVHEVGWVRFGSPRKDNCENSIPVKAHRSPRFQPCLRPASIMPPRFLQGTPI